MHTLSSTACPLCLRHNIMSFLDDHAFASINFPHHVSHPPSCRPPKHGYGKTGHEKGRGMSDVASVEATSLGTAVSFFSCSSQQVLRHCWLEAYLFTFREAVPSCRRCVERSVDMCRALSPTCLLHTSALLWATGKLPARHGFLRALRPLQPAAPERLCTGLPPSRGSRV